MSLTTATPDQATEVVRVAVVDDHESVRLGLLAACVRQGYEFVEEGANVADLMTSFRLAAMTAVRPAAEWLIG